MLVQVDADVAYPIVVSTSEFKGVERIDLRHQYEKDGEFRPTRKGINLLFDDRDALVESIAAVITSCSNEDES